MLVSIGGVDITPHIQEKSYEVNKTAVNEEWTDADYRKHKEQIRTQIEGSFGLVFMTEETLTDFLELLEDNANSDKSITLSLYVMNTNLTETATVFYDLTAVSSRKISDDYFFKSFTFSLKEA